MHTDPPRHSVSVSVTDDEGRALLIQRRDNHSWEPPGGVLELDESIEDGLRREVHEETGLAVEPVALTGVYKNMNRGIVALVFRCKAIGGQLNTSDETEAFAGSPVPKSDSSPARPMPSASLTPYKTTPLSLYASTTAPISCSSGQR